VSAFWIAALVSLWLIVAILALLVLGLLRRIAPILERAEAIISSEPAPPGLSPGSLMPPFEVTTVDSRRIAASDLIGKPFVLLFVSSGCAPCARLAEQIGEAGDPDLGFDLLVVADDSDAGVEFGEWGSARVAYQVDHEVSHAFETSATPHAFVISGSGTVVAAGYPSTLAQLQALANRSEKGGDEATTDVKEAMSV
jgi:hypothetical protein